MSSSYKWRLATEWILDVMAEMNCAKRTYFIAIHILEKYIDSTGEPTREEYQTVLTSAMFVAMKFEETAVSTRLVNKLSEFTADSSTAMQIINTESEMLQTINWKIPINTAFDILLEKRTAEWRDSDLETMVEMLIATTMMSGTRKLQDQRRVDLVIKMHMQKDIGETGEEAITVRKMYEETRACIVRLTMLDFKIPNKADIHRFYQADSGYGILLSEKWLGKITTQN